jgi:hypothetical protein
MMEPAAKIVWRQNTEFDISKTGTGCIAHRKLYLGILGIVSERVTQKVERAKVFAQSQIEQTDSGQNLGILW